MLLAGRKNVFVQTNSCIKLSNAAQVIRKGEAKKLEKWGRQTVKSNERVFIKDFSRIRSGSGGTIEGSAVGCLRGRRTNGRTKNKGVCWPVVVEQGSERACLLGGGSRSSKQMNCARQQPAKVRSGRAVNLNKEYSSIVVV